jgi:hypothetical protein
MPGESFQPILQIHSGGNGADYSNEDRKLLAS